MNPIKLRFRCAGLDTHNGKHHALLQPIDLGGQFDGPPAGHLSLSNMTQQPFKMGAVYTFALEHMDEPEATAS